MSTCTGPSAWAVTDAHGATLAHGTAAGHTPAAHAAWRALLAAADTPLTVTITANPHHRVARTSSGSTLHARITH